MDIERTGAAPQKSQPAPGPHASQSTFDPEPAAVPIGQQAGDGRGAMVVRRMLRLQRGAGNRAVQRLVVVQRSVRSGGAVATPALGRLQRVQINFNDSGETIFNKQSTTGNNFAPGSYGGGSPIQYQMTRNDPDKSVLVNVRIKFVNRAPAADGSRDGADSELPANDPRRGFATSMCSQLVGNWNSKFVLVGRKQPAAGGGGTPGATTTPGTGGAPAPAPAPGTTPPASPPPPGPAAPTTDPNEVRLRLVFQATPVFDLASTAFDSVVAVYGAQVQAGGDAHPIDAGHWYANRGDNYSAPLSSIYAHEYGHLIGLQDEYSRSNHQMHRLMHRFSPSQATKNNKELDKASVSRMVLQAIRPQLESQITAQGAQLSGMFGGQRDRLASQLAIALRTALRSQATVDALVAQMTEQFQTPGSAPLRPTVPRAAAFQLFDNLSNVSIARDAVKQALSPAGITALIVNILRQVIRTKSVVSIPNPTAGQPALQVAVRASAGTVGQADLAGSSTTLATNMVGAASGGTGGAPLVFPSGTIMGQLQSLAGTWQSAGASLGAAGEEGTLRKNFLEIASANIDLNPVSGARGAGGIYQALLRIVTPSARAAANRAVQDVFAQAIQPTIEAQASQLLSWVEAETQRHTTATGTGTNASAGPPNPALQAAVTQMEARMRTLLQNAQTSSATASEEPATSSTAQPVNYTVQGLMGNNNTGGSGVRPDMMAGTDTMSGVATQFNTKLKQADEDSFTAKGV